MPNEKEVFGLPKVIINFRTQSTTAIARSARGIMVMILKNETTNTYQLRLWVDGEYLCGELRATELQPHTFHIHAENEYFSREDGVVYRNGQVYRDIIDRITGQHLDSQLIRTNHAKVMYDLPQTAIIKES